MSDDINNRTASRLASIDAYRGLVMFLMMAEALRLPDDTLRNFGLIAAAVGVGLVWFLR